MKFSEFSLTERRLAAARLDTSHLYQFFHSRPPKLFKFKTKHDPLAML
jgi:hypothetical protein